LFEQMTMTIGTSDLARDESATVALLQAQRAAMEQKTPAAVLTSPATQARERPRDVSAAFRGRPFAMVAAAVVAGWLIGAFTPPSR